MTVEERIALERVAATTEAAWKTMQLATEAARKAGLTGLHVSSLESVGWAALQELKDYLSRKGLNP
jgi:hypothetical protein